LSVAPLFVHVNPRDLNFLKKQDHARKALHADQASRSDLVALLQSADKGYHQTKFIVLSIRPKVS